ncbi:protein FAR1-RELATED SEQUENCE 3-like [Phragmites australis]|uniref:protein FAR1-RELATED SEQUENCE 3-like n=1 Tax=Phragmites australis TaxID=29695 RepID=UPI002D791FE9|nr:protein FAR1-RELATED SEQUENCE 3-like [Phragmites australis]
MSLEEKAMIRTLKKVNIPTRSMIAILSYIRGGRSALTYDTKDVANYSFKIGRERTMNDMTQMLEFFSEKQSENPGFYYAIDMDMNTNKVKNIFWADAKAREYYARYGDCISFDTTFLTNKYNLPFAPFVGVSAHGNTYLFACAFLGDETASTFSWVFKQFIKAMNGKHPQTIVTDQDGAMKKAIKEIFPNTKHRNCYFHIKKKMGEKCGRCFEANKGLYWEIEDILDNSLTRQEFEDLWTKMINKYNLQNIKYLQEMWKTKERFVPVYFKNDFFPFIQSTARSEGTNGVFKKGVGPQFSVSSFLIEYQRITDTIHNREDRFDYETRNRKRKMLWSSYTIEDQAHDLYNRSIFVKFQHKLKETTALQVDPIEENKMYEVYTDKNQPLQPYRLRKYMVLVNIPEEEYSCVCGMFQKDGILCSHILKVMLDMKINKIPDKYIIERWRKNEKKMIKDIPVIEPAENSTLRFNILSRMFVTMASNGSKTKRKYEYLLESMKTVQEGMHALDEEEDVEASNGLSHAQSNSTRTMINGVIDGAECSSEIQLENPDKIKPKGRPHKQRIPTIVEGIKMNNKKGVIKRKNGCSHCRSKEHNRQNCPNKHIHYDLPKKKRQKKTTGEQGGKKSENDCPRLQVQGQVIQNM